MQEGHAILTNERAIAAYNDGAFEWEMFPVRVGPTNGAGGGASRHSVRKERETRT